MLLHDSSFLVYTLAPCKPSRERSTSKWMSSAAVPLHECPCFFKTQTTVTCCGTSVNSEVYGLHCTVVSVQQVRRRTIQVRVGPFPVQCLFLRAGEMTRLPRLCRRKRAQRPCPRRAHRNSHLRSSAPALTGTRREGEGDFRFLYTHLGHTSELMIDLDVCSFSSPLCGNQTKGSEGKKERRKSKRTLWLWGKGEESITIE